MTFVLDKLASEKAGINVFSGTLADLIDAYQRKQHERLSRGEIRNKPRITRTMNTWRKHFAVVFGPISEIKLAAIAKAARISSSPIPAAPSTAESSLIETAPSPSVSSARSTSTDRAYCEE